MANNFSDYLEAAVLNHFFRNSATTAPTAVYVALYTAAPSDAGGGTEVSTTGTAYARQAITFAAPATSGTAKQIASSADVTYAQATADYGTVTHIGIFDAATAGNLLAWGPLTASRNVTTGTTFTLPSGQVTVSLD